MLGLYLPHIADEREKKLREIKSLIRRSLVGDRLKFEPRSVQNLLWFRLSLEWACSDAPRGMLSLPQCRSHLWDQPTLVPGSGKGIRTLVAPSVTGTVSITE